MAKIIARLIRPFFILLDFLTPVGDLLARVWVAYVFLLSGINKLQSWDATIALFTYEYHVPLLSPYFAALLGTWAEIVLPILLILGLGGRFCIMVFFIYNLIAMFSYPFLWTPAGKAGLYQHISWGLLLMLLMFHGAGKLSVDYWLRKKYGHLLKKNH